MSEPRFCADYGKRIAKCQASKCKQTIEKESLRIAKIVKNYFNEEGEMKQYHHPVCLFEGFKRAKNTTKVIEDAGDIEGWNELKSKDKEIILTLIKEIGASRKQSNLNQIKQPTLSFGSYANSKACKTYLDIKNSQLQQSKSSLQTTSAKLDLVNVQHKDNSFREFRRLCAEVSEESSYNQKSEIIRKMFAKGSDGIKFQGNTHLWIHLLLPGVIKRVYNLQSKQLIKIYSRIFKVSEEAMLEDLEKGDVAETISSFFQTTNFVVPATKSKLTLYDIDNFLTKLESLTREDEQTQALQNISSKCTYNDLKMVIRLIKSDLRINAGCKHVLDALHDDAYEAFNSSRNIEVVIDQVLQLKHAGNPKGALVFGIMVGQPIQPMLAAPCKSIEMAFDKCVNGIYSEIKYDGERVQLHKRGTVFSYFSRSSKPVLPHKVKPFKDDIPKAFPEATALIIDAEVLMVSKRTGDPLPFGTLGVHKAAGFSDASPCLFIFDIIHYNGQTLINEPLDVRRKLLEEKLVEVENSVKLSKLQVVKSRKELSDMIKDVISKGLEGLVLKDKLSVYEPGKRHWLKLKKDYLNDGAMADSADLVVLGAWFGTGAKGGVMSIFLMGCFDDRSNKWYTVCKVGNGHDDSTLARIQAELSDKMTKIKQDYNLVPPWLSLSRQMTPDFVVTNPKKSPIWEITGAEFSKAELHTADGISIRFPRVTKIREDKDWETATSLHQLRELFITSKHSVDTDLTIKNTDDKDTEISSKKLKCEKRPITEDYDANSKQIKLEGPFSDNVTALKKQCESPSRAQPKSFDKRIIKSKHGFEMVIKAESLPKELYRTMNITCGVIASALNDMNLKPGEIIANKCGDNWNYALILKKEPSDIPTFEHLRICLNYLLKHMKENNVEHIVFPLNTEFCIIHELSWNAVRTLIKNTFYEEVLNVIVYNNSLTPMICSEEMICDSTKPDHTPFLDVLEGKNLAQNSPAEGLWKDFSILTMFPDIFEGDEIYLLPEVNDRRRLIQYLCTFGAEVTNNVETAKLLVFDECKPNFKANCVHVQWIIDSIKLKRRMDIQLYC